MNLGKRNFLKQIHAAAWIMTFTALPALTLSTQLTFASTLDYAIHDEDWIDTARNRFVPIRIYLPQTKSTTKLIPLVIFSHGIGGSRFGYSYLGQYWASRGFASLHVQHIGSDRSIWLGNPFNLVSRLQEAAKENEALERVFDLNFALTKLLESAYGEIINPAQIIAAGHSYGANTVMLVSGAKVKLAGNTVNLLDPRIAGAILISAPPFYGQPDLTPILEPIKIPTLHITSTDDNITIPSYYSGIDDRLAIFDAIGGMQKSLVVFTGGAHSMFTDRTSPGGAELNLKVKEATQELSLNFMKKILFKQESMMSHWAKRYDTILFKTEDQ